MIYFNLAFALLRDSFRSRASLEAEIICLRQQLSVIRSNAKRVKLRPVDRLFWIWASRKIANWKDFLIIVQPETVLKWQRQRAKRAWWKKSQSVAGRPKLDKELIKLIRRMALENPLWGAPRIHGELLKLDHKVSERVVGKYLPKRGSPRPGGDWATFLRNHRSGLIAIDFFNVFTVGFKFVKGFVVLDHERRIIMHVGATENNNVEWLRLQMCSALPDEAQYSHLLCDNDRLFAGPFEEMISSDFRLIVKKTSVGSPWQNAYVDSSIGSIRRELLNHVVILNESHLIDLLNQYKRYYNSHRTHCGLDKETPIPLQSPGAAVSRPKRAKVLGGLHSVYS